MVTSQSTGPTTAIVIVWDLGGLEDHDVARHVAKEGNKPATVHEVRTAAGRKTVDSNNQHVHVRPAYMYSLMP